MLHGDLEALDEVLAGGGDYPPAGDPHRPVDNSVANDGPGVGGHRTYHFPIFFLFQQFRTDRALHARLRNTATKTVEFKKELLSFVENR